MYLELTPEDTLRDLQNLIIDAIPGFEFPRKNLLDYNLDVAIAVGYRVKSPNATAFRKWATNVLKEYALPFKTSSNARHQCPRK